MKNSRTNIGLIAVVNEEKFPADCADRRRLFLTDATDERRLNAKYRRYGEEKFPADCADWRRLFLTDATDERRLNAKYRRYGEEKFPAD